MPLPAKVESLDKVPEAFRSEYVEQDGAFVLQVDDVLDVFAPGLVSKNKELLGKLNKATKAQQELETKYSGIDLEEYQKLKTAAEKEAEQGGNGHGDAAKALAAFEQKEKIWGTEKQKLATTVDTLTQERNTLQQKYYSTLVTNEILKAVEELDGNAEMLLPAIKLAEKVRVISEDGKEVVRVLGSDDVVLVGDSKGTPMTVKQYIETEFKGKTNWAGAFKANGAGGSGASHSTKLQRGVDLSKLSPTERLKAVHRSS